MNRSLPSLSTSKGIPLPCVRLCCLDEQDVCLGCHRTLEQINNGAR